MAIPIKTYHNGNVFLLWCGSATYKKDRVESKLARPEESAEGYLMGLAICMMFSKIVMSNNSSISKSIIIITSWLSKTKLTCSRKPCLQYVQPCLTIRAGKLHENIKHYLL
jgi:hypothetical protein